MADTVKNAFDEFNRDFVNLEPERTKAARNSRDWLIEKQLTKMPEKIADFPRLYDGKHIKFGSFARNTKIRPLDDIDLIFTFHAEGTTYTIITYGQEYYLNVPDTATNLRNLCNNNGTLNSIKLVNKIVSSLKEVEQYKSAETHKRQEAATLELSSYEWNFDILPAFYTDTGYYVIPDGKGNWKATDPRIDQKQASTINQKHGGAILQIIRTLKYWNRRASMPTISSYLFENMILNYFDSLSEIDKHLGINLRDFWKYLQTAIYSSVPDPKEFQGDLNVLSADEKSKISLKAKETYEKSLEAYKYEAEHKNHKMAINKWRDIFGNDFPTYG